MYVARIKPRAGAAFARKTPLERGITRVGVNFPQTKSANWKCDIEHGYNSRTRFNLGFLISIHDPIAIFVSVFIAVLCAYARARIIIGETQYKTVGADKLVLVRASFIAFQRARISQSSNACMRKC